MIELRTLFAAALPALSLAACGGGGSPASGLAMGFSHFRHPFDNLPYTVIHTDGPTSERNAENMLFDPFDMPAAHIFKIGADGLVHEIEAMGFTSPYNSPTGWE